MAGCQANLVAVRAVASCRADSNFALRQFAGQSIFHRYARVGSAGYAHSLIYIGTAGKRVADSAAETGCSTAERFNFRRVVMGFVFKQQQPFFGFAVNFNRHNNGAGVNFFRFVQIVQLAFGTQFFHADNGNVHQGNRAFGIGAVHFVACFHIFVKGSLYRLGVKPRLNFHIFNLRHKSGMAAVVRPVSIEHFNLGNGRFTVFFIKIFLAPQQIVKAHGKAVGSAVSLHFFFGKG